MSQASSKRRYLLRAARNAMLTALAMDALGTILENYPEARRMEWLAGDRTSFPKVVKGRRASINTDMLVLLATVLERIVPGEDVDMAEYVDELAMALRNYHAVVVVPGSQNRYIRSLGGESDTGIAMPVGFTLGVYAACASLHRAALHRLVEDTCCVMQLCHKDSADVGLFAFLAYRLLNDGYFGYVAMRELFAHGCVPPLADRMVRDIMCHHADIDYLCEPFACHSMEEPTYSEAVLAEAMFYMCRVDLGSPRTVLPSGPKDQLGEVFTSDECDLADIGFVYGGYCTLSEQGYSLVTKPLREGTPGRKVVEDFFRFVA